MNTRFFLSQSSSKAVLSAALSIFIAPALFGQLPGGPLVRNVIPPVWQAADVKWCRDVQPHNRIDDLIDASTNRLFDVIVNFSHCPTDNDINYITANTRTGHIQMR